MPNRTWIRKNDRAGPAGCRGRRGVLLLRRLGIRGALGSLGSFQLFYLVFHLFYRRVAAPVEQVKRRVEQGVERGRTRRRTSETRGRTSERARARHTGPSITGRPSCVVCSTWGASGGARRWPPSRTPRTWCSRGARWWRQWRPRARWSSRRGLLKGVRAASSLGCTIPDNRRLEC